MRVTNRLPKGMLDAGYTRRADCTGQIGDICQGDRTETSSLDFTLYQSNGPVADRSGWHQYDDVNGFIFQVVDDLGSGFFQQDSGLQVIAHESIM